MSTCASKLQATCWPVRCVWKKVHSTQRCAPACAYQYINPCTYMLRNACKLFRCPQTNAGCPRCAKRGKVHRQQDCEKGHFCAVKNPQPHSGLNANPFLKSLSGLNTNPFLKSLSGLNVVGRLRAYVCFQSPRSTRLAWSMLDQDLNR